MREAHFLQHKQLIPHVAADFEDVRATGYTLEEPPIQFSSGDPVISVVQCIEFCRGKSIPVGIFPAEAARPLAYLVCFLRGCSHLILLYSGYFVRYSTSFATDRFISSISLFLLPMYVDTLLL